MLNVAGGIIYCLVALACYQAWSVARGQGGSLAAQRSWAGIGIFFVMLAISRWLVLEESFRERVRDWARGSGIYESRVPFQFATTVTSLIIAGVVVLAFVFYLSAVGRRRAIKRLHLALAGVAAMLGLIFLRMVSLHVMDGLLYGGLHLNWFFDIGISVLVGAAALIEWRKSRD